MSLKDSIRKITVGSSIEYKTKEMEYKGEKVIFKQPPQSVRRDIVEKSSKEDGNIDTVALQVWAVIYLTHDEKGDRVFSESDYESFMQQPVGSFVDKFAEEALKLMGNPDEGEVEND